MSSHHSGAYQCEACDVDFSSQEEFEQHRIKEHSSSTPSNKFSSQEEFEDHRIKEDSSSGSTPTNS